MELDAVHRVFGARARVHVARDITAQPGPAVEPPPKVAGQLELAFVSRISRMKNLEFAIQALTKVRGRVRFNVYGPIEEPDYWAECRRLAGELPSNVSLHYRGLADPDRIAEIVAEHHVFFLPTQGESFGHAIVEALMAGRPALISDQTPWHGLADHHAGWDLPLSRPDLFTQAIERCVEMSAEELAVWTDGARKLGREIAEDPGLDAAHDLQGRRSSRPSDAAEQELARPPGDRARPAVRCGPAVPGDPVARRPRRSGLPARDPALRDRRRGRPPRQRRDPP
jgi:glycosyltransferase involved in cell wall biosynthesis